MGNKGTDVKPVFSRSLFSKYVFAAPESRTTAKSTSAATPHTLRGKSVRRHTTCLEKSEHPRDHMVVCEGVQRVVCQMWEPRVGVGLSVGGKPRRARLHLPVRVHGEHLEHTVMHDGTVLLLSPRAFW